MARLGAILLALARQTSGALLVVAALASLVFLSIRVLPGDPTTLILGELSSVEARDALRARLHLDEPLWLQYAQFLWGLGRLDFGDSLASPGTSAAGEVWRSLGPTAELGALAVLLGTAAGLVAALLAVGPWLGERREWVHGGILAVAATPLLACAPLLTLLFAVEWALVPLPGDPESGLAGLFFASALLALPLGAQVARIGRAALLEQAALPYLRAVAAKGGSPLRVWGRHALPVASSPIAVVVAAQLGSLLGGAVVLEKLFERRGLGTLMIQAYAARDLPVLEASVVAAGCLFVLAQAAAGAFQALVDPRVRSL